MVKIPNWYKIVSDWPETIAEASGLILSYGDKKLVQSLATDIMGRWRATAGQSPNPHVEFERLYKANEHNAMAAITAILELVKVVGAGKELLPQYEDLLK